MCGRIFGESHMRTKRSSPVGVNTLLNSEEVRRVQREGQLVYAAVDVVAVLSGSQDPAAYWADLKQREPQLAQLTEPVDFPAIEGKPQATEGLTVEGVMRVV